MQGVGAGDDGYTLLFDVWVVANSTRAVLDEALRPSGLSAEEFALYSAVRRDGGITPTELASLMALPPTTVSSIVATVTVLLVSLVRKLNVPDVAV